ncbi:MAG: hypothetical protein V3W31_08915 [Thermodesulfobacteriota bacterium]
MEKQISIVVAASGEIKDIALTEGATVRDVLNEANLQGYQLSRKGGEVLDPNTDIYSEAMDSEKLYATPEDVSVGEEAGASPPALSTDLETIKRKVRGFLSRWWDSKYPRSHTQGVPFRPRRLKKKEFGL